MKRVFLYIRVSTQEQAQEGYSVGEQKERLVAYCKAHDWLITEIYVDPGYSGSNLNRPGIQKLITDIKGCDIVLVYKLDRLISSKMSFSQTTLILFRCRRALTLLHHSVKL